MPLVVAKLPTIVAMAYKYNMGQPFIYVVDGNYCNRGELYLAHELSLARGSPSVSREFDALFAGDCMGTVETLLHTWDIGLGLGIDVGVGTAGRTEILAEQPRGRRQVARRKLARPTVSTPA